MNKADGVIIDGAIRDLGVLEDKDYCLAVYAIARSLRVSIDLTPAEENVQTQCGDALVRPDDLMVGDDDGVIMVPSWMAEEVLRTATKNRGSRTT